MTPQDPVTTFKDLCHQYSTWVLQYTSESMGRPIFLVWYSDTDENSTDRLLSYQSGDILAIEATMNLKSAILSSLPSLIAPANLKPWLDKFSDSDVTVESTYDLASIEHEIAKNNLDIGSNEGLACFINLYGDYVKQDNRNADLRVYLEEELIQEVWNYYYDFIFWPRFNDGTKFEVWERPELIINTEELLVKIKNMRMTFENRIKL